MFPQTSRRLSGCEIWDCMVRILNKYYELCRRHFELFLKTGLVVFGINLFAAEMCVFSVYNIWYFHLHELVVLSLSELD